MAHAGASFPHSGHTPVVASLSYSQDTPHAPHARISTQPRYLARLVAAVRAGHRRASEPRLAPAPAEPVPPHSFSSPQLRVMRWVREEKRVVLDEWHSLTDLSQLRAA